MDTKELESGKMKAMKELADINLLISEGKASLIKIESDKKMLINLREDEISKEITKFLENSRHIVAETKANYQEVKDYHETIKEYSKYVKSVYDSIGNLIKVFFEKTVLWKEEMRKKEQEISEIRAELKRESESIERDKERIKLMKLEVEKDRGHLESQQKSLETGFRELKNLWEKVQKKS